MRTAVFGRTGQVATELSRVAGRDMLFLGWYRVDFTDLEAVAEIARDLDCDGIINALAYTAVDDAEEDEVTARAFGAGRHDPWPHTLRRGPGS